MDLLAIAHVVVAVAFGGCLVAIAACDLRSYSIPNSVCVALAWLFVVAAPLSRVEISFLSHLYSFLIVFALGLLAFRFGILGGGDVKSWAAIAAWYDLNSLSIQVLYVTLIGSGLGLLILACRRAVSGRYALDRMTLLRVPRLLRVGEPVPYGVAISVGTALSVGHIDLFRSFPL